MKMLDLPKISKRPFKKNEEFSDFPLPHYSYSSFVKFFTNPFMFNMNYKKQQYLDSTQNISGIVGKAVHKALEAFQGGNDDYPIQTEGEGLKAGLEVIEWYIMGMPDGFIKWSSTIPDKKKAIEKAVFAFSSYVSEYGWVKGEEVLATEMEIKKQINVEYKGEVLNMPIKLKGFIDIVIKRVPKGKKKAQLSPLDYKVVSKFSNPDKIDGAKMFQAILYYFLAYMEYGEKPYSMIYREIKHTKNRDGGKQVKEYEFVYEDHKLMFDFFFRAYDDVTRAVGNGEMVYVPNISDFYDADISIIAYTHKLDKEEEVALMMEEEQVDTITELLKRKLQLKQSMGDMIKKIEGNFAEAKTINYDKMKTIEEKIKMKLLTLGVSVDFVEKIHGSSVDRYLFKLAVGVRLREVKQKAEDIALLLGVDSVAINAQKGMSETVYMDVPRENRQFFDSIPMGNDGEEFNLSMGVSVMGEHVRKDIRKFPHLLVAGATGSGKSVFMESILQQLKDISNAELVLIDPKGTEMQHLKSQAVAYTSDIEEAEEILNNEVKEMNKRFKLLANEGARDVSKMKNKLPYRFIVFDEFGDFIAQNHKKIVKKTKKQTNVGVKKISETATITEHEVNVSQEIMKKIQLLSQKARAAGIHMIIATQRPSVDVITGAIKGNFPAKAVFKTAKSIDSRVVMDEDGAEKLLGKGDFLLSTDEGVERLQGYNV